MKTESKISWLLTGLFFIVGVFLLMHHEMWRDELQAWSLSKSSDSIYSLYQNTRHESHPLLWYLCIKFVQLFTLDVISLQWLSLVVASAVVFLFVNNSPFKLLHKILFTFGYFAAYEYSVISRNYGIGILILFGICILFFYRSRFSFIYTCILLFLLMQTNVFAFLISFPLFLFFSWHYIKTDSLFFKRHLYYYAGGICIFIAGAIIAVITIIPAESAAYNYLNTTPQYLKVIKVIDVVWKSFAPVAPLQMDFWNNNFLDHFRLYRYYELLPSLFILAFTLLFFLRKPVLLITYIIGMLMLLGFIYTYFGYLRHHGYVFFYFLACVWMGYNLPESKSAGTVLRLPVISLLTKYKDHFLTVIFSLQVVALVIAAGYDIKYPFSRCEDAAQYIKDNHLGNLPVVGDVYYVASPVAILLDKPVYLPCTDRMGTYTIWGSKANHVNDSMLVESAKKMSSQNNSDVILLLSYPFKLPDNRFEFLVNYKHGIVKDEEYYIYRYRK